MNPSPSPDPLLPTSNLEPGNIHVDIFAAYFKHEITNLNKLVLTKAFPILQIKGGIIIINYLQIMNMILYHFAIFIFLFEFHKLRFHMAWNAGLTWRENIQDTNKCIKDFEGFENSSTRESLPRRRRKRTLCSNWCCLNAVKCSGLEPGLKVGENWLEHQVCASPAG